MRRRASRTVERSLYPSGNPPKSRRLFCPTSQARLAKIYLFPNYRNYDLKKPSRPHEGRNAIVTIRGAGCDGRVGPQGVRQGAYGQAVWSCPPDAGVKRVEMILSRWWLKSP